MKRTLHPALVAGVLVFAGCATSGGAEMASPSAAAMGEADHGAHAAHAHHEMAAPQPAGFTAADVAFMQGMIGHHAQALIMTAMAPERASAEFVLRLAEKIDISQKDEIALMQDWLQRRNQPVPDMDHAHHVHMPGMLSDQQLARLRAARGRDFDRLFLSLMIQHHEGALVMVDTLFASPGAAQDSDIYRFATDVATDQHDEIDVMYHMLEMLDATPGA